MAYRPVLEDLDVIDNQPQAHPARPRWPAGVACFLAALVLAGCAAVPDAPPAAATPPASEQSAVVPAEPLPKPPPEPPTATEEQLIAAVQIEDSVFFERGATEIGEHQAANLRLHAERLKSAPKQRVTLIGYTENLGSRAYSVAIADKRVEAVYSMLRKLGVPAGQIRQRVAGVERNGKACNSEKCRRLMRRVELKYAKPRKGMAKPMPKSRFPDSSSIAPPAK